MNRCLTTDIFSRRALARLALGLGLLPAALWAQTAELPLPAPTRTIPPHTHHGVLQVTEPPNVLLNGQVDRLSPGARIRGPNNMLVVPGAMLGQELLVRYRREAGGLIHEVWVLTPDEVAALPRRNPLVGPPRACNPRPPDRATTARRRSTSCPSTRTAERCPPLRPRGCPLGRPHCLFTFAFQECAMSDTATTTKKSLHQNLWLPDERVRLGQDGRRAGRRARL